MRNFHIRQLVVAMAALLCSISASAYDLEVGGIFYNITSTTDFTVEVSRSNSNDEYSSSIVIPEKVTYSGKTYSVTSIGELAFYNCSGLTSVIIPNSVTSIGKFAFQYCKALTGIEIPSSVTFIGDAAFEHSGIVSIALPASLTNINAWMFNDCSSLKTVTIPNSVTSIGDYAFKDCPGLTSVTIPNSVTSIGKEAFKGCSGLTSVTIGNSVTSIGQEAFDDCYRIERIVCTTPQPPIVGSSNFTSLQYMIIVLYVPKGSLATYQAADTWKDFWDIQEFDPTGVDDVADDAPAFEITAGGIQLTAAIGKAITIYTANGALVEKIDSYAGEEIILEKGVYIICIGSKSIKVKL